jgi:hypothetical protein
MEKILIVGTIRDPDARFNSNLNRIIDALPTTFELSTFFVESDSESMGLKVLDEAKLIIENFNFVSLGNTSQILTDRIERIRTARNKYVEYIRTNISKNGWKYVVVADLDGMNGRVNSRGLESSFRLLEKFDGVFANQKHGYYDLYALRCEGWVDEDPITELYDGIRHINSEERSRLLGRLILNVKRFKFRTKIIYKKMIRIDQNAEPVKVISAFGGLGIYKTEIFLNCDYSRYDLELRQSEHVDLHFKASNLGYQFAINPKMINSNWNTHNINRLILIRLIRNSHMFVRLRKKIRN